MRVSSGSWIDLHVVGAESVVLLERSALRLSALGTVIVETVASLAPGGWLTPDVITAVAMERLGVPDDLTEADRRHLVTAALIALADHGIVSLELDR